MQIKLSFIKLDIEICFINNRFKYLESRKKKFSHLTQRLDHHSFVVSFVLLKCSTLTFPSLSFFSRELLLNTSISHGVVQRVGVGPKDITCEVHNYKAFKSIYNTSSNLR